MLGMAVSMSLDDTNVRMKMHFIVIDIKIANAHMSNFVE
ncbi:hypothetical protein VCHENC02_1221 [Vibrio harveyi]|uniref:Uncharacterized protein n=1 Tax=Vibrio harveyi TaxID=669 RepID=A0A454D3S6_VIBHA|nr:hypothetical protein VCHENC02_1221 [Vibrio harveyi]